MDCPALRCAAESVWHGSLFAPTPHGFGSLLMFEYIGVCAALQPQFDIISKPTPFACRKGVSPLTAIDTLIRCTTFTRSKWLAVPADWWQTSLHSVAANEPHAAVIGSTLRANELRRSGGKDSRTTLPPVCGSFHSHSLLRSLPMPTTCRARTERCSSLRSSRSVYRPPPQPPMWAAFRTSSACRR